MTKSPPSALPARLIHRTGAFPRVGDELAVDRVGQATFVTPGRVGGDYTFLREDFWESTFGHRRQHPLCVFGAFVNWTWCPSR